MDDKFIKCTPKFVLADSTIQKFVDYCLVS